ncbi:sensor histidine kinase [Oceanobacillus halophilus]|uniref:histidine kinase n=1 Tax=Oceanobacillus halophilus TaxID=930130 RepID=A0A495A2M4_9BACI|nr:histidine kinase [Oceanobacillus halophilus]RKQ33196.1 sensor histidine kinase [Oceanobacillus halophilus]
MSYNQLKWFILLIPTITVGAWEYIRHEYLLPYISMDLGNWLTPVIVLFVTFTLLTRFFSKLEQMQEELRIERAKKAVLEEREKIAEELHDGLAQSLFLLSIKVRQLDKIEVSEENEELFGRLRENIHDIHDYVRLGINNLKTPIEDPDVSWKDRLQQLIHEFETDSGMEIERVIEVEESLLKTKEQSELLACLHESFVNIQKHAEASVVNIQIKISPDKKYLMIKDNGRGFTEADLNKSGSFGLKMMVQRCQRINWNMDFKRENGETIVTLSRR